MLNGHIVILEAFGLRFGLGKQSIEPASGINLILPAPADPRQPRQLAVKALFKAINSDIAGCPPELPSAAPPIVLPELFP
jgi:hypothetical protein